MLVMELHGKKPSVRRARPSSDMVIPDGKIGLEYEWEFCSGFNQTHAAGQAIAPYFHQHSDGSLRNSGTEFVLREPLFGEELITAVKAMEEASRVFKFRSSYRTSMHVHLDMERASYPDQVLSLAVLYAIAEPFLYKFVGNSRDLCNYCIPWYRHDQHFTVFLQGVHNLQGKSNNAVIGHLQKLKEYKYSGLNFFSLGDFGTVEFRQAPVGLSSIKVLEWINLIQSIKKFVQNGQGFTYSKVLSYAFSKDYRTFFNEVFGEHTRSLLKYTPRPEDSYHLGLKTASAFSNEAKILGF